VNQQAMMERMMRVLMAPVTPESRAEAEAIIREAEKMGMVSRTVRSVVDSL
jgi:organic hydroperoxide reductase OsmC/OhrA